MRVVRDIFNEDFTKLIVSGDEAWDTIREYVGGRRPGPGRRGWSAGPPSRTSSPCTGSTSSWPRRWTARSGCPPAARWSSTAPRRWSSSTSTPASSPAPGGNLEETVTRNNIEAAEEIVRQLRLRDLGGIIVIDFIDMVLESNRDLVMRRLLECLGRDRTKHQVAEVTSLGLVQMTRKRVGQGLLEAFSETCDKCNGRGVLVHMEPVPVGHGHGSEDAAERGGNGPGRRRPAGRRVPRPRAARSERRRGARGRPRPAQAAQVARPRRPPAALRPAVRRGRRPGGVPGLRRRRAGGGRPGHRDEGGRAGRDAGRWRTAAGRRREAAERVRAQRRGPASRATSTWWPRS